LPLSLPASAYFDDAMPKSRRRTQKKTSLGAEPSTPGRGERVCYELSGPDVHSQVEEFMTEEDDRAMRDAAAAEANGDPALAIECLLRGIIVGGSPRLPLLRELVDLGGEAPSWAFARWVVDQAYRWMLMEKDPRVDDAVLSTIATCYPDVDLERPLGLSLGEFGTRLAAGDWLVDQLATYELDGLSDFLTPASPTTSCRGVGRCVSGLLRRSAATASGVAPTVSSTCRTCATVAGRRHSTSVRSSSVVAPAR